MRRERGPAIDAPSVSVVLPVLMRTADRASVRLLRRALESALGQDWPGAFEIIVIDDGSPTPAQDAMRRAGLPASPAIRWLRNGRNEGVSHAMNVGIREARYELIARLDADDRWLPGKIAAQLERFRNDPDLSLVGAGTTDVDAQGWAVEEHRSRDGWENVLEIAAERGRMPFSNGSVVALAAVYRLLGGCRYGFCEDYHLWSNWIRFFKPATVERPLYEKRRTPGRNTEVYENEHAAASRRIGRRTAAVVDWRTLPGNVRKLAGLLGVNLLQCGAICCRLWRFRPTVTMPGPAVGVLRRILPDRDLVVEDAGRSPVRPIGDLAAGFPGAASAAADGVVVRCAGGYA